MAAVYGKMRGNGGEVTRTGTHQSGIMAQVQTYHSGVRVDLTSKDIAVVLAVHPTTGRTVRIWEGNVADLLAGGDGKK